MYVFGSTGWFLGLLVTTEQSQEDTRCGSFNVALSNTNNCAVKPLFSELLRKVSELAESERGKGGRAKDRGTIMEK